MFEQWCLGLLVICFIVFTFGCYFVLITAVIITCVFVGFVFVLRWGALLLLDVWVYYCGVLFVWFVD